jgi:hypothetical protein
MMNSPGNIGTINQQTDDQSQQRQYFENGEQKKAKLGCHVLLMLGFRPKVSLSIDDTFKGEKTFGLIFT